MNFTVSELSVEQYAERLAPGGRIFTHTLRNLFGDLLGNPLNMWHLALNDEAGPDWSACAMDDDHDLVPAAGKQEDVQLGGSKTR